MPHVVVKIWPGNSEQEKVQLAEKIVQDVSGILNGNEKYISVAIEEVQSEDWTEKVYKPEFVTKMDKLYKKPGFGPIP